MQVVGVGGSSRGYAAVKVVEVVEVVFREVNGDASCRVRECNALSGKSQPRAALSFSKMKCIPEHAFEQNGKARLKLFKIV